MSSKYIPAKALTELMEKLSVATELTQITELTATAARQLAGADGATFVLRDGVNCYYVDEDAIGPLWRGRRFPMEDCISGWAMLNGLPAVIEDIYRDVRIPISAYRPTFVKSLCMVPIRPTCPIGAVGIYWANRYRPSDEEVKLIQLLANSAGIAIENLDLKSRVDTQLQESETLKTANAQLELSINTLAHDLRNPLSSILSFAQLLQDRLRDQMDEKSKQYLSSIMRTGIRSEHTINQLLALSKINRQNISHSSLDLTIAGYEIADQLSIQNSGRSIEITIDPKMRAQGDPFLIRAVIENLLSNAIKYTRNRPVAKIHFGQLPSKRGIVQFFVSDNGEGFEQSDVHKLFKPLSRLHETSAFEGLGFGLASVARIIEAHGGSVSAQGAKGSGATFCFSLPDCIQSEGVRLEQNINS